MASSTSMAFLAMVLVLLPISSFAVDWDNIAPSIAEEICKDVECGKGTCQTDVGNFPGYTCKCFDGWSRTRDHEDEDDFNFLPCVIPNCTLNYGSCQAAPPPVPEKEVPHNISAFDPCYWAYCGEGTCTKNRTYGHRCTCESGFSNLLNVSIFPCYSECTLGSDCSRLGIKIADSTASGGSGTGSGSSDSTPGNHGTSFLPGKFQALVVLMVSFGVATWN